MAEELQLDPEEFKDVLEALDLDPTQFEPSSGTPGLQLEAHQREFILSTLMRIVASYDEATEGKRKRLEDIEDAYNMTPDASRAGQKPDQSRLVSELSRSAINIATAQLLDNLVGTDELISVKALDDMAASEDTAEMVETAKATESFLEAYSVSELDLDRNMHHIIHSLCKLGNARFKLHWEVDEELYRFRERSGKIVEQTEKVGRIKWVHIPISQAISWPLEQTDLQKATVSGYRTYLEPFEYRSLLKKLRVPKSLRDELLSAVTESEDESHRKRMRGNDLSVSSDSPFGGRHRITELWVNIPIEEDGDPVKMQVYLDESKRKVIWADYNYHLYQSTPIFDIPFWRETDSIFATGPGHESLYPQAADTAMWNMMIDNLKLMGNFLILVKTGSPAEAMQDQISPGFRLPVDDAEDVTTLQLGGDLSVINSVMELNDKRHMRSTDINALAQGFGDPVLKSGASPGTYQSLLNRTNRKFKQVDKTVRLEMSKVFSFALELFQQYAPEGIFYATVDESTANLVRRLKYRPPTGNLRQMFRIGMKPPSATANNEQLRMNLMMLYNLSQQHAQFIIELGQTAWGEYDPGKVFRLMDDWLVYFNELYVELLKVNEVPGLAAKAPRMSKDPSEEIIDKLVMIVQQLGEELDSAQQPAGQPEMGGATAGPQLQPAGQVAQG